MNTILFFLRYHVRRMGWRYLGSREWGPQPPHVAAAMAAEGSIYPEECHLLFELASCLDEGCVVEIGSHRGRSTIALGLGSQRGGSVPVYAVEPHVPFRGVLGKEFGPYDKAEFFRNVSFAGVGEVVFLINLKSEDSAKAWDRPISLLWIDGDHTYEAVKTDCACWEPFVKTNGLIAFHDTGDPDLGPYKVVQDMVSSGRFRGVKQVRSTTVLRKLPV